jgi:subtilisin family serine protease
MIFGRHALTVIVPVLVTFSLFATAYAAQATPRSGDDPAGAESIPPSSARARVVIGLKSDLNFAVSPVGARALPRATARERDDLETMRGLGMLIRPLFSRPKAELEAERVVTTASDKESFCPDLSRWLQIELPEGLEMAEALELLRSLPSVEEAYAAPKAVPASAGADSDTPLFIDQQGYLELPPGGMGIKAAWKIHGGKGQGVGIADVEGDWNVFHEDLGRAKQIHMNGVVMGGIWYQHGTAVLGLLVGTRNNYGITGIANRARLKMFSIGRLDEDRMIYDNVPDAINRAAAALERGDVILIEVQYSGLKSDYDYIPVEYYGADFDAIRAATAKGIVVVEAAGNGSQNLDKPFYHERLNKDVRGDSRAIMVGAGAPPISFKEDRSRLYFSNYGSRVDVQGWGSQVTSTGYGDLYSKGGNNHYYTESFNGTSSASATVAGAVACLQGIAKKTLGKPLKPRVLRKILVKTGSPQQGVLKQNIGPRPDLVRAVEEVMKKAATAQK